MCRLIPDTVHTLHIQRALLQSELSLHYLKRHLDESESDSESEPNAKKSARTDDDNDRIED